MEREGVKWTSSYQRERKLTELKMRTGTRDTNGKRSDVALNLYFMEFSPFSGIEMIADNIIEIVPFMDAGSGPA